MDKFKVKLLKEVGSVAIQGTSHDQELLNILVELRIIRNESDKYTLTPLGKVLYKALLKVVDVRRESMNISEATPLH